MKVLIVGVALLFTGSGAIGQSILVVGGNRCLPIDVAPVFQDAGFNVSTLATVAELDNADLSGFDVVWLPNGIADANPSCPATGPIPNPAGEANLVAFMQGGGGVYFAGETASFGQEDFMVWRDPFIETQLGGGPVSGQCECQLGKLILLDPALPIHNTPNTVTTILATTGFTGGFDDVGNGTPIAFAHDFESLPVVVAWDHGDLTLAPDARLIAFNNSNNLTGFGEWAVNAATWLAGDPATCAPDLDNDGDIDSADLNILLAAFGQTDAGDTDGDGDTDSTDLNNVLAAFGGPCP